MMPARMRLPDNPRERNSEANNDATEVSVDGHSGQHLSHGQDCPSAVECAPSRAETYAARSEARGFHVTRSSDAFGIRQRSKRGGHDGSKDTVSNGSSSSSALFAKKRKQKHLSRTRVAQRKMQACVDAANYDTLQILAREDGRKMRARNMEGRDSTPRSSRGFGTDVTNRGVVGSTINCGTGDVNGEAPRSPIRELPTGPA